MNELFRFVTIRQPEKNEKLAVDATTSREVVALQNAKDDKERNFIASGYRKNKMFISSETKISPQLLGISAGIEKIKDGTPVRLKDLLKTGANLTPAKISNALKNDKKNLIFTFAALKYLDNHTKAKQMVRYYLGLIRLLEDPSLFEKQMTKKQILNFITSIVIVLPPKYNDLRPGTTEKDSAGKDPVKKDLPLSGNELKSQYKELITARNELLRINNSFQSKIQATQQLQTRSGSSVNKSKPNPLNAKDIFDNELKTSDQIFSKNKSSIKAIVLKQTGISLDHSNLSGSITAIGSQLVDIGALLANLNSPRKYFFYQGILIASDNSVPQFIYSPGKFGKWSPPTIEPQKRYARILGIGELRKVIEEPVRYELAEIAYIENVMKTETRSRKHIRDDKTTIDVFTSSEKESETEKDLQSTNRFSMNSESSEVVNADAKMNAGLKVSASYGPVGVDTSADVSASASRESSNKSASTYSRDVTERAKNRVIEKIKEERRTTTITEIKEINKHSFVNDQAGAANVAGIYRWVNKISRAKLVTYDQRMWLEFMIPEPAALYLYALSHNQAPGSVIEKPDDEILNLIASDITEDNYQRLAAKYEAKDIEAPLPEFINVTDFADVKGISQSESQTASKNIPIPDGYQAHLFEIVDALDCHSAEARRGRYNHIEINVGTENFELFAIDDRSGPTSTVPVFDLIKKVIHLTDFYSKTVPFNLVSKSLGSFSVSIVITCSRLPETFSNWQIKTFNSIMNGYQNLKSQFDEQLAVASIRQSNFDTVSPDRNRVIERIELKRAAISMLTGQQFDSFGSLVEAFDTKHIELPPSINSDNAFRQGKDIQFFENAFEWTELIYVLYPYFWGRKKTWIEKLNMTGNDPDHVDFLQSGEARVDVPVRPGYEESIIKYLDTGEIWNGGDPPALDSVSPAFVEIATELAEQKNQPDKIKEIITSWEYSVPTTLVMLQPDEVLPVFQDGALT